jgi:hypothetical protein
MFRHYRSSTILTAFDAIVAIAAAQGAMALVWMGAEALAGCGALTLAHPVLWVAGSLLLLESNRNDGYDRSLSMFGFGVDFDEK